jgi:hypothetical protein
MEGKKIINFAKEKGKYNKKISDEEINALFLGLVKIVKRSAEEELSDELKKECAFATENFRQCLMELNDAQMNIKKQYNDNQLLQEKLNKKDEQICLLVRRLSNWKHSKKLKKRAKLVAVKG